MCFAVLLVGQGKINLAKPGQNQIISSSRLSKLYSKLILLAHFFFPLNPDSAAKSSTVNEKNDEKVTRSPRSRQGDDLESVVY